MKKISIVLCLIISLSFFVSCKGGWSGRRVYYSETGKYLKLNFDKTLYDKDEDITLTFRIGYNFLEKEQKNETYKLVINEKVVIDGHHSISPYEDEKYYTVYELDLEHKEQYSFTVERHGKQENIVYGSEPTTVTIPRENFPEDKESIEIAFLHIYEPQTSDGSYAGKLRADISFCGRYDYSYDEAGNLIINKI